jgi:hypothetical protein
MPRGDVVWGRMRASTAKLLLMLAVIAGTSGCASIGPPEAPSLELPKPPTDLRATRKGDKGTLTWTIPTRTTERQSVRYLGKTQVCRNLTGPLKQCDSVVGDVVPPAAFQRTKSSPKKLKLSFTDTLPASVALAHPREFGSYGVEVLNEAGRGAGISNQVQVSLVPTTPPLAKFDARVAAQGVVISWRCPTTPQSLDGIQYLFRIYRRQEAFATQKVEQSKIADVDASKCVAATVGVESSNENESFVDQTFDWEQTYFYRGTVVSVIETAGKPTVEIEGDDTTEVKVFAHDVFPPAVPLGLQAVFSGPGQVAFIDLIWSPVTDADLAGYNVYRHESGGNLVKLNTELVKTPAYRDINVVSGRTYIYSVSAVDERGNESGKSQEASEAVGD